MPLNEVGQDRFSRRLTRELDIPGDQPAPVLAPEIQPVIVLEGERAENLWLAREYRYGASLALAAVVNEYAYFALHNPAGSNTILTVEQIALSQSGTASYWDVGQALPTIIATLAGRTYSSLDLRRPQTPTGQPGLGVMLAGTDPNAGFVVNIIGRIRTGDPDFRVVENLGYVIPPGELFGVWCGTKNLQTYGYFWWRERAAMDGELT